MCFPMQEVYPVFNLDFLIIIAENICPENSLGAELLLSVFRRRQLFSGPHPITDPGVHFSQRTIYSGAQNKDAAQKTVNNAQ